MMVQRTGADVQAASTLAPRDRLITKLWVDVYDGSADGYGCSSWQHSRLTRAPLLIIDWCLARSWLPGCGSSEALLWLESLSEAYRADHLNFEDS